MWWPEVKGAVPSPTLVAAWRRLDLEVLETVRLPLWAAYWIAAGYDGTSLVSLASAERTESVRALIEPALDDCGVELSNNRQARHIAFTGVAEIYLLGLIDAGTVAGEFLDIWSSEVGPAEDIFEPKLQVLYEIGERWEDKGVPRAPLSRAVGDICSQWLMRHRTALLTA